MTNMTLTEAWRLYLRGVQYNQNSTPSHYNLVNTNRDFFADNQWVNMAQTAATSELPKPVFNIIKRITNLFVASIASSGCTIAYEPLEYYNGSGVENPNDNASEFLTAEVRNLLEKFNMEYKIRECLFDGAQTGDYCGHFWFDPEAVPYRGQLGSQRGEIKMELVDSENVMFGNPLNADPQAQPYIIIAGMDTVSTLREMAKQYGKSDDEVLSIVEDTDLNAAYGTYGNTQNITTDGGEDGNAQYVYLYRKKKVKEKDTGQIVDTVYVTMATKSCSIFEDIDTGLSLYPVAWGRWEKQRSSYHGRALTTGIIPNQILINRMMAMVAMHLMLTAFPKTVFNQNLISKWDNRIGQAIGVKNLPPGTGIDTVAKNLAPAEMSTQIYAALDRIISLTKECLGATDAQMGNIKPDNTSAIMVLQSSSAVPLENPSSNLHEFIEQIGAILPDMMGTYYGERPVVREREFDEVVKVNGLPQIDTNGQILTSKIKHSVVELFDFAVFKTLYLKSRIDVGASSNYSEISTVQTLDNLRRDGVLDTIQYLERIPDRLIPRKAELLTVLKEKTTLEQKAEQNANAAGVGAAMGGQISNDKAIAQMPQSIQGKYQTLPNQAQKALLQSAKM